MIEVISILVVIIASSTPYLRKKYFLRPKNVINVKFSGGRKRSQGLSPANKANSVYIASAIHIYDITWDFEIKIRNDSEIDSYSNELNVLTEFPGNLKIINLEALNNIASKDEIILEASYNKQLEATPAESPNMRSLPNELKEIEIKNSYKNPSSTSFCTYYYGDQGGKNEFKRI